MWGLMLSSTQGAGAVSCKPVKVGRSPLWTSGWGRSCRLLGFSRHRLKIWLSLEYLQESSSNSQSGDFSGREM